MTTYCKHCNDPIPASRLAKGDEFCCNGCAIAFSIIQEHGGEQFYDLCDVSAQSANTAVSDLNFCNAYNSEAFAEHYIQQRADGLQSVTWYVQGAHCAACVWLLERIKQFDAGVHSSRVHIGKQQLMTVFDPHVTNPQRIAECLAQLGYHLYPWHSNEHQQAALHDQRNLFVRFAIACGAMAGCMHVSWNILAGEYTLDLDEASRQLFALMAALLSIPAITYCAWPWYRNAWNGIKQKHFNIDVSIASIIILGSIISFAHLALGRSDLYFDAMCMFICFLLGGRVVLHLARQKVGNEQDALKQLLPLFIKKYDSESDSCIDIGIEDIGIGDTLHLQAGQRSPVDARLQNDFVHIDNALLSGETLPLQKQSGDRIPAGAKIIDQDCQVIAENSYHHSSLATLLDHEEQNEKEKVSDLSDRLLQWFTPVVSILALITWLLWSTDPSRAWDQAIAVFIVACPCALGIAAPLAQAVFMRHAASHGILMSNTDAINHWQQVRHVVFDKTGTLTEGQLALQDMTVRDERFNQTLPYILAACKQSQHPIARALLQHYEPQAIQATNLDHAIELIPHGMAWQSPLGSMRIQKAQNTEHVSGFNQSHIFLEDTLIAACSFHDDIRSNLRHSIDRLQAQDIQMHICSGDLQENVERVATAFAIPSKNCVGNQSPTQKQQYIKQLKQDGAVMMIGDGVNDALALEAADIAVGVRGGLEAAMKHSDVYVSNNIGETLPQLWPLVQSYRHNLFSCLMLSLIYNILGIAAAMLGWWGPFICAVAMPLSSLSVIILAWSWPFPKLNALSAQTTSTWSHKPVTGALS